MDRRDDEVFRGPGSIGTGGFSHYIFVEVVRRHAGIQYDALGIDAAGPFAEKKQDGAGHLPGGQGFAPESELLGVQIRIYVTGDSR